MMKKFIATVDLITINNEKEVVDAQQVNVEVYGKDRQTAILNICDVGQSIARFANESNGRLAIYYRVIDVIESGTI